jgi:hypothetical protein
VPRWGGNRRGIILKGRQRASHSSPQWASSAGLRLLIADQILIGQFQHASRQSLAPEGHQPVKPGVIGGDIQQIVAVIIIARGNGEEIAEIGQHRIHRMPPQAHDPRLRRARAIKPT